MTEGLQKAELLELGLPALCGGLTAPVRSALGTVPLRSQGTAGVAGDAEVGEDFLGLIAPMAALPAKGHEELVGVGYNRAILLQRGLGDGQELLLSRQLVEHLLSDFDGGQRLLHGVTLLFVPCKCWWVSSPRIEEGDDDSSRNFCATQVLHLSHRVTDDFCQPEVDNFCLPECTQSDDASVKRRTSQLYPGPECLALTMHN